MKVPKKINTIYGYKKRSTKNKGTKYLQNNVVTPVNGIRVIKSSNYKLLILFTIHKGDINVVHTQRLIN